jgi:ABC-type sugar transport system permease subunit
MKAGKSVRTRRLDLSGLKGWLYLLPAFAFLGIFMVYPLIDVLIYSLEEGYNFASQTHFGVGIYNYSYVLHDPYFIQAVKNTFILVIITVPLSTGLALVIALALSSIQKLRDLFQTIYFLPYVTNTLAVGLVFMILFDNTESSTGLVTLLIRFFGGEGASVQTDFSHLTLLERFIYLLQIPVLYCCTNHVYFNNLTTSSTVMVYETTSPISRIRIKWTLPPSAFLSRLMISAISSMLYGHSG